MTRFEITREIIREEDELLPSASVFRILELQDEVN